MQENLDKAKAARRVIIRYIQLVNDESFVGTLLDANEKVVESILLYDRVIQIDILSLCFFECADLLFLGSCRSPRYSIPTRRTRMPRLMHPNRVMLTRSIAKWQRRSSRRTGLASFSVYRRSKSESRLVNSSVELRNLADSQALILTWTISTLAVSHLPRRVPCYLHRCIRIRTMIHLAGGATSPSLCRMS